MRWNEECNLIRIGESTYVGGNPALIGVLEFKDGYTEDVRISVNLNIKLPDRCFFIKEYDGREEAIKQLVELGILEPTGEKQRSGFVDYKVYKYNPEKQSCLK